MLDFDPGAADHHLSEGDHDQSIAKFPTVASVISPIDVQYVASLELVIVTKRQPGFDAAQIESVRTLIADIVAGHVGPCKFLLFDLDQDASAASRPATGFEDLITDLSDLIFQAPVVSVAWVRRPVAGPDLELALACSMLVAEEGASFTFGEDIIDCVRSYALLAHRIGFVQAERLMESAAVLTAETMAERLLVQQVVPAGSGTAAIEGFVKARTRRHNSACGIYRAQRIAMLG